MRCQIIVGKEGVKVDKGEKVKWCSFYVCNMGDHNSMLQKRWCLKNCCRYY